MRRTWLCVGVVLIGTGCSAVAAAAPKRGHDSREAKARAACAAGRVDEGVALLVEIAAKNGDPNALYNQARCYQQNGRSSEALARFKEYRSRVPDLPPTEAAQVDGFIRDLEAEVAAKDKPMEPVPPTPPPVIEVAPAPPPVEPVAAPAPQRGRGARIAAAVLAVAGAAALGAGVYFSLRVRAVASDLESPTPIDAGAYRDKVHEGQQAETRQWIAYGVGAAALVGAAVVVIVGRPAAAAEPPRVALAPLVGRGGGGAALLWRF